MGVRGARVFTIGYEGRQPDELIAVLRAHRVTRVLDIRILPLSRKPGFSKTPLARALAAAGIDYVHVRAAGNPYRKLAAPGAMLAAYRAHLAETPDAVDQVAAAIAGQRAALLCVEHDPAICHRSVMADRLRRRGATIVDL